MIENKYKGLLVAVDGPNGAGKSTLIEAVCKELRKRKYKVIKTKEPSQSILGKFVKEQSEYIDGNALACLVAANRYEHLIEEIIPALEEGKIVLSDRYIFSSFILQRLDNVDIDFIKDINNNIIIPDIQIVLLADDKIIKERLLERHKLHRFERDKALLEIKYTKEAIEYLNNIKFNINIFNTEGEINNNVKSVVKIIENILKTRKI